MKKELLLTILATATFVSTTAYAGSSGSVLDGQVNRTLIPIEEDTRDFYIGTRLGTTNNGTDVNNLFTPNECGMAGVTCSADDSDRSVGIFGGYQINENFAVELGYSDLGTTANLNFSENVVNGLSANVVQDTKVFSLTAVGKRQLGNSRFSVYGKAGISRWKSDISFDRTPNSAVEIDRTVSKTGVDPILGVGLEYKANDRITIGVGLDRHYNVGEGDVAFDIDNNALKTVATDVDSLIAFISARY